MSSALLMRVGCARVAVGVAVGADRTVAMGTIAGDCNNGDAVADGARVITVGIATGSSVGSSGMDDGVLATTTVGTAIAGVASPTVGMLVSADELQAATSSNDAAASRGSSQVRRLN